MGAVFMTTTATLSLLIIMNCTIQCCWSFHQRISFSRCHCCIEDYGISEVSRQVRSTKILRVANHCRTRQRSTGGGGGFHVALWSALPSHSSSSSASSSSSSPYTSESDHETLLNQHTLASPSRFYRSSPADNGHGAVDNGTESQSQQRTGNGTSRSGRSMEEIRHELANGKVLSSTPDSAAADALSTFNNHNMDDFRAVENENNNAVIDFAHVKNEQSRAERALARARMEYLSSHLPVDESGVLQQHQHHDYARQEGPTEATTTLSVTASKKNELMGINGDVVAEVGHALGSFADNEQDIQDCAAWLRSTARMSSKKGIQNQQNQYTPKQILKYKAIIEQAYEESGQVTAAFAKTFYLGTQLMNESTKRAIWAIYVWCRRTDEIVDAPRVNNHKNEDYNNEMLRDLSAWEIRYVIVVMLFFVFIEFLLLLLLGFGFGLLC